MKNHKASCIYALMAVLGIAASSAYAAPANQCASCHSDIAKDHAGSVHKDVNCAMCHNGTKEHLKDYKKRPSVSMDPNNCGACHTNQYKSLYTMSDKVPRTSKKIATGPAPDPFFDRALGAHGFTKEHDLPRGHQMMVIDQFIVDRAFGGRFEPKDGWFYSALPDGKSYKAWKILKDAEPETNTMKRFKPGTALAANGVCWSCKSTDVMLDWAYMGDKKAGAKFNRGSNPVDIVRNVDHAINCNFCHDPHSGKPRIQRDALIDALTRGGKYSVYRDQAKNPTKVDVKTVGMRGFDRKLGYLDKPDSRLMCAQCHVE